MASNIIIITIIIRGRGKECVKLTIVLMSVYIFESAINFYLMIDPSVVHSDQ